MMTYAHMMEESYPLNWSEQWSEKVKNFRETHTVGVDKVKVMDLEPEDCAVPYVAFWSILHDDYRYICISRTSDDMCKIKERSYTILEEAETKQLTRSFN